MAACHPKLKTNPGAELFLSRFAEAEWRGVIRPWLEAGGGLLERAFLVAPTRGQTQALKQRCVVENIPLLGVEFLTPGLARRKRLPGVPLAPGLQELVLRTEIEDRLRLLGPEDPARGLWKSLASDLEAALGDFHELLRAGFKAADFRRRELGEVFGALVSWVERHRYALAPLEDEAAALEAPRPERAALADRLLILAGGAEGWGEFFGLVALAKRCARVTVVVAEPEFSGRGAGGEEWVALWNAVLGVEAAPIDAPDPADSCAAVAELWNGDGGSAERAEVIVGASRSDEIFLAAEAVVRLLERGGENIAVVFPRAGSAHARFAQHLADRGVPFTDLVGTAGTPPLDTLIQRALVDFYERGCRLEELLALWPLLGTLGLVRLSPGAARKACQGLFDETQQHGIEAPLSRLQASKDEGWRELGRVAALLVPGWPSRLTPSDALARFEAVRDRLNLAEPAGWSALREFARRAADPMPAAALLAAIRGFLPEKGPASGGGGPGVFSRVTLTTCRRAVGLAWSDAVFVESNARIWPERREPSPWLGDEARRELNPKGRFSLGVATGDLRTAIERRLYCAIARDTARSVVLSAALFDEESPELRLGPNPFLERVLWMRSLGAEGAAGTLAFERLAAARPAAAEAGRPAEDWLAVWNGRRDPARPFDEHFFGDPSGRNTPHSLSASQIERGIEDPARIWFDAVLRVARVEWRPFARARRKAVGTAVHRVLAAALRGAPAEGNFFILPAPADAGARLAAELAKLRAGAPRDSYWDSFHLDVGRAAREMLDGVFRISTAGFGAVEAPLPEGATVPVGKSKRLPVYGRVDLVLSDRPGWSDAAVEVVDFKTGGGSALSARRMASQGLALQLGVYLLAAQSAGATGRVWMFKPEEAPAPLGMDELEGASAKLQVLGAHLATGIFGARTPDRNEYSRLFEWPLACAPVASAILESKFEATFGAPAGETGETGESEHG
jgi:hypothetical protein